MFFTFTVLLLPFDGQRALSLKKDIHSTHFGSLFYLVHLRKFTKNNGGEI
jgi:hypothetical protein